MQTEPERLLTIFVNGQKFSISKREMTGTSIKALAGLPSDYELYEVKTYYAVPVPNDKHLSLRNNQWLRGVPPGTASKHGLIDIDS